MDGRWYLFEEGSGEVSSLDCHISQHPLLVGFLQNVFLDRSLTDQSEKAEERKLLQSQWKQFRSLVKILMYVWGKIVNVQVYQTNIKKEAFSS